MENVKKTRQSVITAALALLLALIAAGVATFAWYIYNTRAHTTSVRMAAGAGVSLQISNKYEGPYGSSAVLDEFVGILNPVSTDNILNGFQKVVGFTNGNENQSMLLANLFGSSADTDYYKTSLFFRTNSSTQNVYLAGIGYEDNDANNPISTAIRVGFVAHAPGQNQSAIASTMRIFAINEAKNPQKQYNTYTGSEGSVLDSTKTDGTTVPFTPSNSNNFCNYDANSGTTTLKEESVPLLSVSGTGGTGEAGYGTPVQLDVYIWLEGCDEDCTNNLSHMTLQNLALSFAAHASNGASVVQTTQTANNTQNTNNTQNANDTQNAQTAPVNETPAAPANETPASETQAVQEAPANETPANETPANETPANEAPANETPAATEAPANETPANEG